MVRAAWSPPSATSNPVALGGDQAARTIILMRLFDMGIPVITSALAIWAIVSYRLTEEKAHEVRQELERRRGKVSVTVVNA